MQQKSRGKYSTSMEERGTLLKEVKNTPIRNFLKNVNKNTWNFLKTILFGEISGAFSATGCGPKSPSHPFEDVGGIQGI